MADGSIDIEVKVEAAKANAEIDALEANAKQADREVSGIGDGGLEGVEAGAKRGSSALGLLKGAIAAVGIGTLVSEAVSASDSLTKFDQTMSAAGFGRDEIDAAKASMKGYADQTVYDTQTMMSMTAQLAANGISDYVGLGQAAGNLNAAFGGTSETMKSVSMVMTQTAGQGKLVTENWNQLTDAIPGAAGKLQEAMLQAGAYTGNFREAMEKGEITADEFNAAIASVGGPLADAATSTETFEGAVGNASADIVSSVQAIIDKFKPMATDVVSAAGTAVSGGIGLLGDAIQLVADNASTAGPPLAALVAGFVAFQVASGIASTVQGISAALTAFKAAQDAATLSQAALNAVMNANPFVLIVTLVAGLVAALITAYNTSEDFRNAVNAAFEMVSSIVGGVVSDLVRFFTVTVPGAIQGMQAWFSALPGNIGAWLTDALSRIGSWVAGVASDALSAGSQFLGNIVAWFSQLPGRLWGFLTGAVGRLGAFVGEVGGKALSAGAEFLSGISQKFGEAVSFVAGIPGRLLGALGDLGGMLVNSGRSLIDGLVSGIRRGFDSAVIAVKSGLDFVRGFFPFSPAKRGPFSGRGYTTYSGYALMRDMAKGIRRGEGELAGAAEASLSGAWSALSTDPSFSASLVSPQAPRIEQTVNFNQPVESAAQMLQAARHRELFGLAGA